MNRDDESRAKSDQRWAAMTTLNATVPLFDFGIAARPVLMGTVRTGLTWHVAFSDGAIIQRKVGA
jgi:hypothetical protein